MDYTFASCTNCHSVNKIQSSKAKDAVCGKCKTPIKLHGLVSEATADDFRKLLRVSDKPVVVDFWASWCGPCKVYGPEFEKASLEHTSAVFVKVNTETEQQLSVELGIRGIPCTLVFKGGKEILRQAGAMDAQNLSALLRPLL